MDAQIQASVRASALVPTAAASKYLQQLCKHFAHRRPVIFDAEAGEIGFSLGTCKLRAPEGALAIDLSAPSEAEMAQLRDVVVRHLLRFAFRETLEIQWHVA